MPLSPFSAHDLSAVQSIQQRSARKASGRLGIGTIPEINVSEQMSRQLRELTKRVKPRDFVAEIKKTWQIKDTKLKIHYEPSFDHPHTESGLDKKKQLHLTIFADPREDETIIFHEGAHVYLSYIGYPSLHFANRPQYVPEYGVGSTDFIDEYYAIKLELNKIGKPPAESVAQLCEYFSDNMDNLVNGEEAAIYAQLLKTYNPSHYDNSVQLAKEQGVAFEKIFRSAVAILQQAPPLPEPPNKFTESDRSKITQLLEQACETVYNGRCVLKPPDPYPHSKTLGAHKTTADMV